jgi:hypothetical protein
VYGKQACADGANLIGRDASMLEGGGWDECHHRLCMLPINPTHAPNPHDRSAVSQTYGSRDTTPRVHDAQHYPVLSFRLFIFWPYGNESSYRLDLSQYPVHQRNGSRHAYHARAPTLGLPMDTGLPHGWRMLGPYYTVHASCCHELHTSCATLAYGPE